MQFLSTQKWKCESYLLWQLGTNLYLQYHYMVFLPSDHVLDTNITVANVAKLTMCGDSSSDNIATVGFRVTNMVDFNT